MHAIPVRVIVVCTGLWNMTTLKPTTPATPSSKISKVSKRKTPSRPRKTTPMKKATSEEHECCGCVYGIKKEDDVFSCPKCGSLFHADIVGENTTTCWKREGGCCDMCQECAENKVSGNHGSICDPCWEAFECDVCHGSIHRKPVGTYGEQDAGKYQEADVTRCDTCGQVFHSECSNHICG